MALNATAQQVLDILDANTGMDIVSVGPFLTAANRIVMDRLTGRGVPSATLTEIERWLAAHLIAMSDRETGLAAERVGDASVTYAGKLDEGLRATRYGQMALALDPSGALSRAGKRRAGMDMLDHISGGSA